MFTNINASAFTFRFLYGLNGHWTVCAACFYLLETASVAAIMMLVVRYLATGAPTMFIFSLCVFMKQRYKGLVIFPRPI